jgi:hypothetical protein
MADNFIFFIHSIKQTIADELSPATNRSTYFKSLQVMLVPLLKIRTKHPYRQDIVLNVEFPGLTEFYNRTSGSSFDRIYNLIFQDFKAFLITYTFLSGGAADAIALHVASQLFDDDSLPSDPTRAMHRVIVELSSITYSNRYLEVIRNKDLFQPLQTQVRRLHSYHKSTKTITQC